MNIWLVVFSVLLRGSFECSIPRSMPRSLFVHRVSVPNERTIAASPVSENCKIGLITPTVLFDNTSPVSASEHGGFEAIAKHNNIPTEDDATSRSTDFKSVNQSGDSVRIRHGGRCLGNLFETELKHNR